MVDFVNKTYPLPQILQRTQVTSSASSCEFMRLRIDIIQCFKIVKSLIELKFDYFFVLDPNTRTRGHSFKLQVPRCQTSCRRNFFAIRIVPIWNSLPQTLVNCSSLLDLKHKLKAINLSKFLARNYDALEQHKHIKFLADMIVCLLHVY